jgi:quercetin dioxygenase-like cupin family protein
MSLKVLICAAGLALAFPVLAAENPITRTQLQKRDFPDHYVSELVRGQIVPHGLVARHTHPGIEIGYIEQGEALVKIEGRPDQRLKRGDSFAVTPGTPHSVQNMRADPLVILSTYVVDRDKPLSTPAPEPGQAGH